LIILELFSYVLVVHDQGNEGGPAIKGVSAAASSVISVKLFEEESGGLKILASVFHDWVFYLFYPFIYKFYFDEI